MPQVDPATIKRRAAELRATVAQVRQTWLSSLLGQKLEILAERDGTGHAPNFARVQLPDATLAACVRAPAVTRAIAAPTGESSLGFRPLRRLRALQMP